MSGIRIDIQFPAIQLAQLPPGPYIQLTQLPSIQSTQLPTIQLSSQLPDQLPSQLPDQLPSQLPDQLPSQLPDQSPSQSLNQLPSQSPSTMPLPPEARYESLDALTNAINEFSRVNGYAFTKRRSKVLSSGRRKIIFDCDRHGSTTNHRHQRQRHTNTRLNGCRFSISAIECIDNRQHWEVKHRPGLEYSLHNHPPSIHPSAHAIHRRLQQKERKLIRGLTEAGKYSFYIYIFSYVNINI
jgi:hypothetical protein